MQQLKNYTYRLQTHDFDQITFSTSLSISCISLTRCFFISILKRPGRVADISFCGGFFLNNLY